MEPGVVQPEMGEPVEALGWGGVRQNQRLTALKVKGSGSFWFRDKAPRTPPPSSKVGISEHYPRFIEATLEYSQAPGV